MKHKREALLFVVILVLSLIGLLLVRLFTKSTGYQVKIFVDQIEYGIYSLQENQTICIETAYGKNIVEIFDGEVNVKEADCPDQICVRHLPIAKQNEVIVCLPHKLVVEVHSEEKKLEIDAVSD